jgi:predicted HD superfamily hydrolase involved in NAD metabolism
MLSPARVRHTLSVARWARRLATVHGEDAERAELAGLLHDCAKELSGPALAGWVRRRRLAVPDREFILRERHLGLFHAYVSADRARREFGIADRAVLRAIAGHTLGHSAMTALDKVLYVADFSSPDRRYPAAARVRRIARRSLDGAFRESLRMKLTYVLRSGRGLHPQTVRLWNRGVGEKGR